MVYCKKMHVLYLGRKLNFHKPGFPQKKTFPDSTPPFRKMGHISHHEIYNSFEGTSLTKPPIRGDQAARVTTPTCRGEITPVTLRYTDIASWKIHDLSRCISEKDKGECSVPC